MKKLFLILCAITILLISCVRSLYPITEDPKDIVFRKELLGHWKATKDNSEYIIDSVGTNHDKNYTITLLDNSNNRIDTSYFWGTLVNIKGRYFMDCIPNTTQTSYSKSGEQSLALLIPTHFIVRIYTIEKNYFTLSGIDNEVLLPLLKNKKVSVKHEKINKDEILLTEKPKILQQKLLELEHFSSVYKKDSLIRIKGE